MTNRVVLFWLYKNEMRKALLDFDKGGIIVYDEKDKLLYKRMGITRTELKKIQMELSKNNKSDKLTSYFGLDKKY